MDDRPDQARDDRALAAVVGQFFLNGAVTGSYVSRAPQLRDQIGVDVDAFGLLLTMAAASGIVGSLLAGRIIHTATTRRVLRAGALLSLIVVPLIGGANGPAAFLAALSAFVFVDVLVDISMNLQGSWISARRDRPVMNRLHGAWSIGTLTGGLGGAVANGAGLSPLAHLVLVCGALAVPLAVVTRNLLRTDETAHDSPDPGTASRPGRTLPFVLIGLAGAAAVVTEIASLDWAAFRLADDFDAPGSTSSLAFVAVTLGMTTMRFAGDSLQVRLGPTCLFRLNLAVTGVGLVLATLVPSGAVALSGFLVVGIGVATFMPRLYDDAARLPGRRGAGLGALTAGMRVAFLASPVVIGGLAAGGLDIGGAVAVVALPALAGLALSAEATARHLGRSSTGTH